jgi:radical SAM superfamily enzyme with C-terminal helix-hairpin-helix motif
MRQVVAILDCYTVEPSGLGVPPFLSPYVRGAYGALCAAYPDADVRYLTIDDVRWCLNEGRPYVEAPLSDPHTYSVTASRDQALQILADARVTAVIAGDAVPSVHLQARNGSADEITQALAKIRGKRILLGPLATHILTSPEKYEGLFDAVHTHTMISGDVLIGSRTSATYAELAADRSSYTELVGQLGWRPVAEIELYRGCTRRRFCSFCNEPIKSSRVEFRDPADVICEITQLYAAGVRNFRLGQQTCFFSYLNRDVEGIERLLAGIRNSCPALEVLHIDNADPLAVASPNGAKIAQLVARYCSEGNCAPMGIESFDGAVITANALTCTPEVLIRAIENINEAGAVIGPRGLPVLLPGLNLIYGLPGETHRTHYENLRWLARILDDGYLCHRINVRQALAHPGTPFASRRDVKPPPSAEHFATWKSDISYVFDQPMKERVYPTGRTVQGLHSFFVTSRGTWHRRLGSYSIQVIELGTARPLFEDADLVITGHEPRFIYGKRDGTASPSTTAA